MDRFAKLREAVAATVAELERGEKPRLQGTLANLYFGFNPGEFAHQRREQLVFAIGDALTESAERGFLALLLRQPPPLLADLARMNAANEYHPHWYAILAGMDLHWQREQSVAALSKETIEAVFALSLLLSTWDEAEQLAPVSRRAWSQDILNSQPELACQVYEVLLSELLREKKDAQNLLQRLGEVDAARWRSGLALRLRELVDAEDDPGIAEFLRSLISQVHPSGS